MTSKPAVATLTWFQPWNLRKSRRVTSLFIRHNVKHFEVPSVKPYPYLHNRSDPQRKYMQDDQDVLRRANINHAKESTHFNARARRIPAYAYVRE